MENTQQRDVSHIVKHDNNYDKLSNILRRVRFSLKLILFQYLWRGCSTPAIGCGYWCLHVYSCSVVWIAHKLEV